MVSVEKLLDLHLPAANPVSLMPVNFCNSDVPTCESYTRNALELSPRARAKLAPKPHDLSDPTTDRYRLNVLDFAQELEARAPILTGTDRPLGSPLLV